jgi:tetratricopeptide (TPR) repeat protein
LKCAFIHPTFKRENSSLRLSDNQKLEFLGDAVLGLVISEYTYGNYSSKMLFIRETLTPKKDEGKFSQFREKHIGTLLSEIADNLGLDVYLLKGNGECNNDEGKASRLEDLMEALIGAIYRDTGYDYAKEFVLRHFKPYIEKSFLKMYEKELYALDEEIKIEPDNYFLLTSKGMILHELSRYVEALKPLNEALKLNPECEEALDATNKLISLNPTFEFIWSDKGKNLFNLGKTEEALEAYTVSVELDPDDPDTFYEIAKIYSSKQDKEKALLFLKKAIECEKEFDEIIESGTPIKSGLKKENDFEWLFNDEDFEELVNK